MPTSAVNTYVLLLSRVNEANEYSAGPWAVDALEDTVLDLGIWVTRMLPRYLIVYSPLLMSL